MKAKYLLVITATILFSACAVSPVPLKRPLNTDYRGKIQELPIRIDENKMGVGMTWTYSSSAAAGAQYGFIGAIVSAAIDAIVNAGPAHRAGKAADELAMVLPTESLNQSALTAFENTYANHDPAINFVPSDWKLSTTEESASKDKLQVSIDYRLSEDASTMRVEAIATLTSKDIPYKTPYKFEKSTPKTEKTGPIYRNKFTYISKSFPIPTLTDELRAELIKQINERYTDASGNLPKAGTDDDKKMQKELEEAKDDKLSKSEASIFLIREWTADDGAAAASALQEAHAFIAKQLLLDLNRDDIPSLKGEDKVLETLPDGRTILMTGSGTDAGSITSNPVSNGTFSSWGNTVSFAKVYVDRENARKAKQRSTRSKAKRSSTKKTVATKSE